MSKKVRVMIAVLVATLLLAVSGTAAVMAQDDATAPERPGIERLLSRVASILGIGEDELAEAFQQARQEMQEECLASGNGTCEQRLNRFQEKWQEKRQEWPGPRHGQGRGHGFRGQDRGNFGASQATSGQQMTATAAGGQGTVATGFAGQGVLR